MIHARSICPESTAPHERAYQWGNRDLEDTLQATAAQANGAAYIISRNVKDFRLSHVPALTPSDYLAKFHPG